MADEENTKPSAEPAEETTKVTKKAIKKKAAKKKAVKKKAVKKKAVKKKAANSTSDTTSAKEKAKIRLKDEEAVKEKLEEKIKAAAANNAAAKPAVASTPTARREEKDSLGMLALLSIALLVFVGVWALYSYLSGDESGLRPDEQAASAEAVAPVESDAAAPVETESVVVEEIITVEEVAPAPEAEAAAPGSPKEGFFDRLFGSSGDDEAPAVVEEQPAEPEAPAAPEAAAVEIAPAPSEAATGAAETEGTETADTDDTEESGSFIGNLMDKFIHSEEKQAPAEAADTASEIQEAAQPAAQTDMPVAPAPYGPPPGYGYPPRPYGAPYGGPNPYGRPAPYGGPAPYGPPPGFFDDRGDMMPPPPPMPYSGYGEPAPTE